MSRWLDSLQPFGALLLRLVLGAAMVYNGYDKVVPPNGLHGSPLAAMAHFSHFVGTLGLPPWLGYVSALTEFVGGAFLVVGLLTRFVAFLIAINMTVALVTVNLHKRLRGVGVHACADRHGADAGVLRGRDGGA